MVSVCIATYNGEKYIYQQIKSILSQLKEDDEVVISDDSSTDNTLEIIKSFKDSRIRIYSGQIFRNPIFNFENALKHASGEFIFLSDQDDIWHEKKLTKMMSALQSADIVVSDCRIIDDANSTIVESYFKLVNSAPGIWKNMLKNTYLGCCMAFRKKVLNKALPFSKDIPMHDIWLGFVCDVFYKSIFINEQLTFYRKHNNNASITADVVSNYSVMRKLKFRFNIIKYFPLLLTR